MSSSHQTLAPALVPLATQTRHCISQFPQDSSQRTAVDECWHSGWVALAKRTNTAWQIDVFPSEGVMPVVWLRSTAKWVQALPLVEAELHHRVSSEQLAIACASHVGSAYHQGLVQQWLSNFGLSSNDLRCGVHPPIDPETRHELFRQQQVPSALHHNCSGKHAAMLAVCHTHHWPLETYLDPGHPIQQAIAGYLQQLAECAVPIPIAIDGCGVPTFALPLGDLAKVAANWVTHPFAQLFMEAIIAHPVAFGGKNRVDTAIIQASNGKTLAKVGADGVMLVCHRPTQQGVALKVATGHEDARNRYTVALLQALGWLPKDHAALLPWQNTTITNTHGMAVGQWRFTLPPWGFAEYSY